MLRELEGDKPERTGYSPGIIKSRTGGGLEVTWPSVLPEVGIQTGDLVVRREPGLRLSSAVCSWINYISTSLIWISPLCDGNINTSPSPAYSVIVRRI